MNILLDLEWRGLLKQTTDRGELEKKLAEESVTLYCGFDPTADSLHIGSLLPILCLRRFQKAGHRPIALVGGGTGLIGDPSGKANERTLNSPDVVAQYTNSLRRQLSRFLDFDNDSSNNIINNKNDYAALMANNYDWLSELDVIGFLRDIGKNFTVNYMLAKDSVDSRIQQGISFTEFSYMILQAYDFLKLNERHGCTLQIGGSDQWGNITAGLELIGKTTQKRAFGLTLPLVTKSDGQKFGKSESGAIWLDAAKTTPYQFYQFWVNTDDNDVIRFLKYFTFLPQIEIERLEDELRAAPEKRDAQRVLAREVTELVHGREALDSAVNITKALFDGNVRQLTVTELEEAFKDEPVTTLPDEPIELADLLTQSKAASSKRDAREHIKNGAVSINGEKVAELDKTLTADDRIGGKYIVLRRGKKNYYLIRFE